MLSIKKIAQCIIASVKDTIRHNGVEHAGYLAFLTLLSFFPFLVFFFSVAGYFGQSELGIKFTNIILDNDIVPENILPGLKPRIEEIMTGPPQSLLTISIIGSIWTASSMVDGLKKILNTAYRVSTPPSYIFRRLTSIFEFLVMTSFISFATFILIILPNLWQYISNIEYLHQYIDFQEIKSVFLKPSFLFNFRYFVTISIILFLVCMIYKTLPNTKQKFSSLLPGAVLVVFLWFATGYCFSVYISKFDQVSVIYGSLAGIITILLFFYITSTIFIFGAEFNYHIARAKGDIIEEKHSVDN